MSLKQSLPEAQVLEQNLDERGGVLPRVRYEVCSWRNGSANSDVPCTEVHLVIPLVGGMSAALRLKSPRALDELVGVLLEYRREVWGDK